MSDHQPIPASARIPILLAVLWLLAGASFKLFAGTPNDLPETIQNFPVLKPVWTFRFAIGTEFALGALVLLNPRRGWLPLALLFVFFDFLLYQMGAAGESKCGCFGGNTPEWLTPFVMMVFDTVLLIGVLVARPWRFEPGQTLLPRKLLTPALLISLIALPWLAPKSFRQATPPKPGAKPTEPKDGEGETGTAGDGTTEDEGTDSGGDWYAFTPSGWDGMTIGETDLAQWLDGGPDMAWMIPTPAYVIIYRNDCEHCREHFIELQNNPITDRAIALIRIPDDKGDNVVDDVKPMDAAVDLVLTELPRGYGITTPVSFDITEEFMVTNVQEHKE